MGSRRVDGKAARERSRARDGAAFNAEAEKDLMAGNLVAS